MITDEVATNRARGHTSECANLLEGSRRPRQQAQKRCGGSGGTFEWGIPWVSNILGFCACCLGLREPFAKIGALRRVAECGWSRLGGDHLLRVAAGMREPTFR